MRKLLIISFMMGFCACRLAAQGGKDSVQVLGEVTVTGARQLIRADLDKFTYNVSYDPDSKSVSLLEILRKVPMVTVEGDDAIKVKGSHDFKVYVNGKPNAMMGNNPAAIMRGMPASSVRKVEVITNPGAKYDAEGTAGILNIITEGGVRFEGYSLTLGGMVMSVAQSENISGLVKVGKLTLSVNDGLSCSRPPRGSQETERTTHAAGGGRTTLSHADFRTKAPVHFLDMQASYEFDKDNLLSVSAGMENYTSKSWTDLRTRSFGGSGEAGYAYANAHFSRNKINGCFAGADYQHAFGEKGGNVVLSYRFSSVPSRTSASSVYADIQDAGGWLRLTDIRSSTDLETREHTGQIDYTVGMGGLHTLSIGGKLIHRVNESDNQEYTHEAGTEAPFTMAPARSISYRQTTAVSAGYAEYGIRLKGFSGKSGLRFEHSSQRVAYPAGEGVGPGGFHAGFDNIVPSLSVGYHLGQAKMLTLSYAMRISRPNIWNLNPYADRTDPTVVKVGNPDLRTATSNGISLAFSDFTQKGGLNLTAGLDWSDNGIIQYSFLDGAVRECGDAVTTTYGNILAKKHLYLNLYLRYLLTRTTTVSMNASGAYTDFRSRAIRKHHCGFTGNASLFLQQRLPWKLSLSVAYTGNSRSLSLQGHANGSSVCRLMLMRSFLRENRLTVTAYGNNIFTKELRMENITEMPDFTNRFTNVRRDFRSYGVSVSLRLGKLKERVKQASKSIHNEDVIQDGNPRAETL